MERGQKRQNRLSAARDQTTVTRSQVLDNQRTLAFNVGQQFVNVLLAQSMVELAQQDCASYQKTIDVSQARLNAGDISEGDLLKIKLQKLQFQQDLSSAKLPKFRPSRPCGNSLDLNPYRRITTSPGHSTTSRSTLG